MKPASREAYELFHEGSLAFGELERAGMRIDVTRLDETIGRVERRIKHLNEKLRGDEVYKAWRKTFGGKANIDSAQQLGTVLFEVLGYEGGIKTAGGKQYRTDEQSLERVDLPFVKGYFEVKKLKKLKGTYLHGLKRELVGEFIHPVFNLHLVITYRSSSDSPNAQNVPVRDKLISKLVRRCYIPRPGRVLVEIDLKANEVRVACCYSKDKKLIHDTLEGDMHRDMAAECYKLATNEVPKAARQTAKAKFVFAEFFGSKYVDNTQKKRPGVARSLWEAIELDGLQTNDGRSLYEHLKANGINKLGNCEPKAMAREGTFVKHIKGVENRFWNKRFTGYRDWKDEWWESYLENGFFHTLTGFLVQGVYSRNQVLNSPIQGSAFHCLLWALIRFVKWLRKYKMQTLAIAQVHDSILLDAVPSELPDVLAKVKELLVDDIRKEWKWLIVPLGVEAEASDRSWYDKEEIEI